MDLRWEAVSHGNLARAWGPDRQETPPPEERRLPRHYGAWAVYQETPSAIPSITCHMPLKVAQS